MCAVLRASPPSNPNCADDLTLFTVLMMQIDELQTTIRMDEGIVKGRESACPRGKSRERGMNGETERALEKGQVERVGG
jgi:hypothetical protein